MNTKQTPQRSPDFGADADEALEAARDMPPGPERVEALKAAGMLRNAADVFGVIFAKRGRPLKWMASTTGIVRMQIRKRWSFFRLPISKKKRIKEAEQLPLGDARRHALNNAAQLRSYAAMKRLVPGRSSGADAER